MKEYLVSWYGITDFKSSLGIEDSGPLLGAIKDKCYTDIQILGYTNTDQPDSKEDFQNELANLDKQDRVAANNFVYKWANSPAAHEHFISWLSKKAYEVNENVNIGFTPVKLKKLNDTEGIYGATVNLLNSLISYDKIEDIYVTLFLSPGTPVMAFCWAMAALKFPQFKKRLIASPDPRKAPEVIDLPAEWMNWYGKQVPLEENNGRTFDLIIHLFGEQRLPTYLGIKQFVCNKHIFVTSGKYHVDGCLDELVNDGDSVMEINVDPYDPEDISKKLLELIKDIDEKNNLKIGFNLTGGTKLMFAGAMNVCRQIGGIPFYFDTKDKKVIFLNDYSTKPIVKINKVENFIRLNGNGLDIGDSGRKAADSLEMVELTNFIWKKRKTFTEIKHEISSRKYDLAQPVRKDGLGIYISDKKKDAYIEKGDLIYTFPDRNELSVYMRGGWFEEYVYNNLRPLLKSKKIIDLRHSLKVSYDTSSEKDLNKVLDLKKGENQVYQELDVTFTDGYRLYIVECKTGTPEVDHIIKLENIVRYYGGIEGKGILVYPDKFENEVLLKKGKESKNVSILCGDDIISCIEKMVDLNE